jgi:hypothetical protein
MHNKAVKSIEEVAQQFETFSISIGNLRYVQWLQAVILGGVKVWRRSYFINRAHLVQIQVFMAADRDGSLNTG